MHTKISTITYSRSERIKLGATWDSNLKKLNAPFFTLAPHISSTECNKANCEGFVEKYSPEHLHSIV